MTTMSRQTLEHDLAPARRSCQKLSSPMTEHLAEMPAGAQMSEQDRTRLIEEIVAVVSAPDVPCEARKAALELVCWLARRMPWDDAPCDFRRQLSKLQCK